MGEILEWPEGFDDENIEKELDKILAEANEEVEIPPSVEELVQRELAIELLCASQPKEDPGPEGYDEDKENRIREAMKNLAHYAEEGKTFDPEGKYLCGTCNYRMVMDWDTLDQCYLVEGTTRMVDGGCAIYEIGNPDSEYNPLPILKKYTQREAMYAERPKVKGFGCSRCEYSAEAKAKDKAGRPSWCGFWGVHIQPLACCDREDGKDLIEPAQEKEKE